MKASDLKIKLEAVIANEIVWHGHLIYQNKPLSALEILGTQMESKNGGYTTPMKYVNPNDEYGQSTLFWLNLNDSGKLASGDIDIHGLYFPVKGFVHIHEDEVPTRMSVTLLPDLEDTYNKKQDKTYQSRFNYVMSKIKAGEKKNNGEDYRPFVTEVDGELSEEALEAYTESLSGFEDWASRNLKKQLSSGVVSPLLKVDEIAF